MLVIVSDLHFQHTGHDAIRFEQDGEIVEMGVRRNVTASAFDLLFGTIQARAARCRPERIDLVFLGDIFEVLRTPLWMTMVPVGVRPWSELGPDVAENPVRNLVHMILDYIYEENRASFETLAAFVEPDTVARDAPEVTVHYVPGNHDRLVSAWPSVRRKVRAILGMAPSEDRFPFSLDWTEDEGFPNRVRLRHGHEYDRENFAVDIQREDALGVSFVDYLTPCFGDYATIDIATRLAVAFRARYALGLRRDDAKGEQLRRLYLALTEFDDVRPPTRLVHYLQRQFAHEGREIFPILRPIISEVYNAAANSSFFIGEASRLSAAGYAMHPPTAKAIAAFLRHANASSVETVLQRLSELKPEVEKGAAECAAEERDADGVGFSIVVAGHTHKPIQVPIPRSIPGQGADGLFIDSGTWRVRIIGGVGDAFGRLRSFTSVFCYRESERHAFSDGRQSEVWTGHLTSDRFGPYHDVIDDALPPGETAWPPQQVRFYSLLIDALGQIDGVGDAEIRLRFGVDAAGLTYDSDGVHPGQVHSLELCVPLRPGLDGEMWAWGFEEDLIFDDPLPWGLFRLERRPYGGFTEGPGELVLEDCNGIRMVLMYVVEPTPEPGSS